MVLGDDGASSQADVADVAEAGGKGAVVFAVDKETDLILKEGQMDFVPLSVSTVHVGKEEGARMQVCIESSQLQLLLLGVKRQVELCLTVFRADAEQTPRLTTA